MWFCLQKAQGIRYLLHLGFSTTWVFQCSSSWMTVRSTQHPSWKGACLYFMLKRSTPLSYYPKLFGIKIMHKLKHLFLIGYKHFILESLLNLSTETKQWLTISSPNSSRYCWVDPGWKMLLAFTAGQSENTKFAGNETDSRAGNQSIPRVVSKPQ